MSGRPPTAPDRDRCEAERYGNSRSRAWLPRALGQVIPGEGRQNIVDGAAVPTIAEWFADATAAPGAGRLILAQRTGLVLVMCSECEQ